MSLLLIDLCTALFRQCVRRAQQFQSLLGHYPASLVDVVKLAEHSLLGALAHADPASPAFDMVRASAISKGAANTSTSTSTALDTPVFISPFPWLLRRHLWPALLGVRADYASAYSRVDHVTWHESDEQLDRDIPRCHQYHELLSSPQGHGKLRRVLKVRTDTIPRTVPVLITRAWSCLMVACDCVLR